MLCAPLHLSFRFRDAGIFIVSVFFFFIFVAGARVRFLLISNQVEL